MVEPALLKMSIPLRVVFGVRGFDTREHTTDGVVQDDNIFVSDASTGLRRCAAQFASEKQYMECDAAASNLRTTVLQ